MRIHLSRKLKQAASALLVTMVLGGILCTFVMYYLALIEQQNMLSVRSQAWNIAIAVSEAGVEEGLQALNQNTDPTLPVTFNSADGWTFNGTLWSRSTYDARESLGGNWYTISIDLNIKQIISRAYVTLPALAANTPSTFFAQIGGTAGPGLITRAVRVRYQRGGFYLGALIAKHKIDLRGNGALTDSFDSESLWMSYYGQYNLAYHLPGDKGDVASNDGIVSTISLGNANIYGKAHTGAEGTVAIGSQGGVGSHAWQALPGNKGKFQSGWVLDNANFTFPDTWLPYSTGLPLGDPADIVTVTYDYTKTVASSTAYPNPPPWSGVTNTFVTTPTTTTGYPAPGTYVGLITTNYPGEGSSSVEKTYNYARIIGTNYTYAVYHTNAIYTTNHYDHVITTGDYYYSEALHGSTIILGTARLVLPNGLIMGGNDGITVAPGGSVEVFAGGTECTIGGNGINNQSGYAKDFILECAPSVTTFTFNGNGEFIGVLVAPEAHMTLNGAGSGDNNFIGCIMMDSISMNGHYSFHYDEALARLRKNPRVLVRSWDEIK